MFLAFIGLAMKLIFGIFKGYGGLMSYRANQVTIINPENKF